MKTKAWTWLVAGVAALGLNGFYQDGGFASVHQIADRIESRSSAVLALATGRADQIFVGTKMVEAKMVMRPEGPTRCEAVRARARGLSRMARAEVNVHNWHAIADRQEAAFERAEAERVRTEDRMAADAARIHVPAVTMNPVSFKTLQIEACPRVHVNVPHFVNVDVRSVSIPRIEIPRIEIPRIEIPRVEIPRIEIPRVEIPKIRIPAIPMVDVDTGASGPV